MSDEPRLNARGLPMEVETAPRYSARGIRLCNGHKRDGRLCSKEVLPDRTKCKHHGGASPRGPASPHWRTGRWSKSLPSRYRAAYFRATQSRDLLTMREQIALLDARVDELLGQLSRSESGVLWSRLSDARLDAITARNEAVSAAKAGNQVEAAAATARANSALSRIFDLIERGGKDRDTWGDLLSTLEQQRKIQLAEVRRRESERAYVAVDSFLGTMAEIVKILREEVPDKRVLSIVSARVSALLPPGDSVSLQRADDREPIDADVIDDEDDSVGDESD